MFGRNNNNPISRGRSMKFEKFGVKFLFFKGNGSGGILKGVFKVYSWRII
jgi:hypothetical protein